MPTSRPTAADSSVLPPASSEEQLSATVRVGAVLATTPNGVQLINLDLEQSRRCSDLGTIGDVRGSAGAEITTERSGCGPGPGHRGDCQPVRGG